MCLDTLRMQISGKVSDYGVADSLSGYRENGQTALTFSESDVQKSSPSSSLCEKMGGLAQPGQKMKQVGFSFQDQDSSSTQSTGQSYAEGIASCDLGYIPMNNKTSQAADKLSLSMGTYDSAGLHLSHGDYNQSLVTIAFPEQLFTGYIAACGPQSVVPARVPLHIGFSDVPIYVNAKQYHGILRRRKHRAKLEAQNKLMRDRKPYLHESRHLHALRRVRGTGGRFVKTKKLESSGQPMQTSSQPSGLTFDTGQNRWGLGGDQLLVEGKRGGNNKYNRSAAASCSDVGSCCTSTGSDFYHQRHQDIGFSPYPSQMGGGSMLGGGVSNNYYM